MSQEPSRAGTDLSALRIQREPEKSGGRGWLLLGAVLVVAVGAAVYFLAGKSLRPRRVDVVTASVVTEGQATTLLSATGYVEAERKADLSENHVADHRVERDRRFPCPQGRRDRASRPHRHRRPARRREGHLGQYARGARAATVLESAGALSSVVARCRGCAGIVGAGQGRVRARAPRLHGDPRAVRGRHHRQARVRRRGGLALRLLSVRRRLGRRDRDDRRVFQRSTSERTSTSRTFRGSGRTSPPRSRSTPCRIGRTTATCVRSFPPRTARRRPCGSRSRSTTPTTRSFPTSRRGSPSRPR